MLIIVFILYLIVEATFWFTWKESEAFLDIYDLEKFNTINIKNKDLKEKIEVEKKKDIKWKDKFIEIKNKLIQLKNLVKLVYIKFKESLMNLKLIYIIYLKVLNIILSALGLDTKYIKKYIFLFLTLRGFNWNEKKIRKIRKFKNLINFIYIFKKEVKKAEIFNMFIIIISIIMKHNVSLLLYLQLNQELKDKQLKKIHVPEMYFNVERTFHNMPLELGELQFLFLYWF